jgi:hypothetical protein
VTRCCSAFLPAHVVACCHVKIEDTKVCVTTGMIVEQASDLDGTESLISGAGGWRPLKYQGPVPQSPTARPGDEVEGSVQLADESAAPSVEPPSASPFVAAAGEDTAAALQGSQAAGEEVEEAPKTQEPSTEAQPTDAGASDDDDNWQQQLEAAAEMEKKRGHAPVSPLPQLHGPVMWNQPYNNVKPALCSNALTSGCFGHSLIQI